MPSVRARRQHLPGTFGPIRRGSRHESRCYCWCTSGMGKTTVATAIMGALTARGYKVQPFVEAVASRAEKFSQGIAGLANVCLLLCYELPPHLRDPVSRLWPLAL